MGANDNSNKLDHELEEEQHELRDAADETD